MKCFVASAFDEKDVDAIFDRAIRPVLKTLGVQAPLRVDRVEHNDDIDNRIFALIDQSDFCIADLTYARPSVYYEAGYAFGSGKPVVYIARSDHFRARARDPSGNKRVHFDLQMKNIISWNKPNDAFKKRLSSRLRYVLAPLLRRRKLELTSRKHESAFLAMARVDQVGKLIAVGTRRIKALNYRQDPVEGKGPFQEGGMRAPYKRTRHKVLRRIFFVVSHSLSTGVENVIEVLPLMPSSRDTGNRKPNVIETLIILVCLRGAHMGALRNRLAKWTPLGNKIFRRSDILSFRDNCPHRATFAIIDNVKSIPAYSENVDTIVRKWESGDDALLEGLPMTS